MSTLVWYESDAYDEGWHQGYHNEVYDNPYEVGSDQFKEFEDGFYDGSWNS